MKNSGQRTSKPAPDPVDHLLAHRREEARKLDQQRAGRRIILWHRTSHAEAILATGFKDTTASYMTDEPRAGVWLSNVPLDINEGADRGRLLRVAVDLPMVELVEYEWIEEEKRHREFLIPASVLNRHARIADATDSEPKYLRNGKIRFQDTRE
jgi:hypothetical protein